jgi:hypothetical protein
VTPRPGRTASPRGLTAPLSQQWLGRLQENWQYVNYQWDRLVIEYDLYSQVKVVEDLQSRTNRLNGVIGGWIDKHLMGFRKPDSGLSAPDSGLKKPIGVFTFALIVSILIALIFFGVRRRTLSVDPTVAFYKKFLDRMARKGFPKAPSETGWEYAERLNVEFGVRNAGEGKLNENFLIPHSASRIHQGTSLEKTNSFCTRARALTAFSF